MHTGRSQPLQLTTHSVQKAPPHRLHVTGTQCEQKSLSQSLPEHVNFLAHSEQIQPPHVLQAWPQDLHSFRPQPPRQRGMQAPQKVTLPHCAWFRHFSAQAPQNLSPQCPAHAGGLQSSHVITRHSPLQLEHRAQILQMCLSHFAQDRIKNASQLVQRELRHLRLEHLVRHAVQNFLLQSPAQEFKQAAHITESHPPHVCV